MKNSFSSAHIYLKYNNKIKKLNWRKNLSSEDFSYLVKSIFSLQGKILGFQSNDGTIYELNYLINHRDHINNSPYQILVKPDYPQKKQYENLKEVKSLKCFEELLEKNSIESVESMSVLGVFTENGQVFEESMEKLDEIAGEYYEDHCKFYWLLTSLNDRNVSKKAFSLQAPVLVFYTGIEKFLEMPINELSLNSINKLLERIKQERESSIYNIDQSDRSTASINSFYIIEDVNAQKEDADEKALSQNTYVLDSKSMTTYDLKSDVSDDERKSTEVFNIEGNGLEDQEKYDDFDVPHKQEEKVIFEEKNLNFKKKQEDSTKSSYFLKSVKKSDVVVIIPKNQILQANESIPLKPETPDEDIGSLSPSKYTDFYSLLHDNVGKFEPEDYGMAMSLYKEKDRELFDLLNDCRQLNDKDLNSFLVSTFARKKFSLWLIDNFSRENIEKLSIEKSIKNSQVYTAYQCFKYDNDLEDLKGMLEKALHKEDKIASLRKPTDSIVENEYSDYVKVVDTDLPKKYNINDLHTINEGSAKDEESPGMPVDYPNALIEKNTEKKYKEMIMAMKDVDEGRNYESGFNLVLVGNGTKNTQEKGNGKKKHELKIECVKDEHPLAREVLEKFFDQGEKEKNIDAFHKLRSKLNLDKDELEHIQHLFDQRDPGMLHIVNKYKANEKDISTLDLEIKNILNMNNIAISSSPRSIKKVQIFNLFKTSIDELFHENRINGPQVKLCLYLFMKINLSILSAFEVFQLTKDKEDFLDSLNLIYKINYVKLEQELDDIEEYDDITETQLKIVYAFQADLELSERSTLETVVKAHDKSLIQLHEFYRKNNNKQEFIQKVKELCAIKSKQLKEFQVKKEKEQPSDSKEEKKNKRKNLIETCKIHRFLKEIPNINIILEAIDADDSTMESICSVYELTLDKQDFTESVKVFFMVRSKAKMLNLIREIVDQKHWTELDFKIISDAIDQHNKLIVGAYQLYDETNSEDDKIELIETLEKFVKFQKNK